MHEIRVHMHPQEWDSKDNPYFWMITINGCNNGHGWSKTPEKAWEDALEYYNRNIKE